MAHTLSATDKVTLGALRVLHQKLNFVGNVNRQYDKEFANEGAKIGDSLRIRLPNKFTTGTGAVISNEDITEETVTLSVTNQRWVKMPWFTSAQKTMTVENYIDRYVEPAMAQLAADVEADALSMYKDVFNQVADIGNAITHDDVVDLQTVLGKNLAPRMDRTLLLSSKDCGSIVKDTKGLFNAQESISKQFKEGIVAKQAGFDIYENTLLSRHATGASAATGYLVNGASQTGSSLIVDTGTGTLKDGDIITIAGVNRVHPETRLDSGELQQFVVTADYAGGAGTVSISPAITTSGAKQNVTGSPADNAAITKVGGASASHDIALAFHKDAFVFATADLVLPRGTHAASRKVMDGISLRFVEDYDATNDKIISRMDILYGFKCVRPELAVRGAFN